MDTREILIANTKTQKRSKINSSATTLAELKADLSAAGIDYSDMTFTEGISKTQLLDDATQLPQNVMYKGQTTNNLVILLTNTKKNIASGMGSRKEAYVIIKAENLQDVVKAVYGKNFTLVSTENLWKLINAEDLACAEKQATENEENYEEFEEATPYTDNTESSEKYDICEEDVLQTDAVVDSITALVNSLFATGLLGCQEIAKIADSIRDICPGMDYCNPVDAEPQKPVSTSDGTINDDDIDDMINDIM